MHQIKIFIGLESEVPVLESEVNTWLSASKARIINVFGNISPQSFPVDEKGVVISKSSFAPSDVLLIVHYEKP